MSRLSVRQGDTLVVNAAFKSAGVARDMTGWTVEGSLQFSNCPKVELTASWVNITQGTATLRLSHEDTPDLHLGEHELRVRAISPSGDRASCDPVIVEVTQ